MKFNSVLAVAFTCMGLFSTTAFAQSGELVVSANYVKPGCTNWEFKEGGNTGAPSDSGAPARYEIFALACNGGYIVQKSRTLYSNGTQASCTIILLNTTSYTLNSSSCTLFEVRAK